MHARGTIRWSAAVVLALVLGGCSKKEAARPAAEETAPPAGPAGAMAAGMQAAAQGDMTQPNLPHACDLVPAAQLKELIGADPGSAARVGPSCQYKEVKMMVNAPAIYDVSLKTAQQMKMQITDVAGLGDKAFYDDIGPTTTLHVLKGDAYFNVIIVKDIPDANQRVDLAKKVAAALLKAAGK